MNTKRTLVTCEHCGRQFDERYYPGSVPYHTPCKGSEEHLYSLVNRYKRKWYHDSRNEKTEEIIAWIAIASVIAACIGFIIYTIV